jgi:hypothetical protein
MIIVVWLLSNSPPAMAGEFSPTTMPSDAATTTSTLVVPRRTRPQAVAIALAARMHAAAAFMILRMVITAPR